MPDDDAKDFKVANGTVIKNFGRQRVVLDGPGTGGPISMGFYVTDVEKPLASVHEICERGNTVCFWKGGGEIRSSGGDRRIGLVARGGTYRMVANEVFHRQAPGL